MKESEVAYIAGVVDSSGLLRVRINEDDKYTIGLEVTPTIEINRSEPRDVVLGMIDEYCQEIGVLPSIRERESMTVLKISGVDDIKRFIEPIEPWMIQSHDQLEIFLQDVLPAIENGKHTSKEGMIEVTESLDEMYELDPTLQNWKWSASYLKQKWSNEL